jgi:hypothetical protein
MKLTSLILFVSIMLSLYGGFYMGAMTQQLLCEKNPETKVLSRYELHQRAHERNAERYGG